MKQWFIRPDAAYSREFVWPTDYEWSDGLDDKILVVDMESVQKLIDALNQIDDCDDPDSCTPIGIARLALEEFNKGGT